MQINGGKLDTLERTLVRMIEAQPPRALYTALLALVDPEEHVASWTDWESGPNTHWRAWFVTDSALAFIHLEFDQSNWYRGPEEDLYSREKFIPTNARECWARPLNAVVEVSISGFGTPLGPRREEMPLHGVVLTFADGHRAVLPSQESLHRDSRAAVDELIDAVRRRITWW